MTRRRVIGFSSLIFAGFIIWPSQSRATEVWIDTQHLTWPNAAKIFPDQGDQVMFARLRELGEARWVQWEAHANQRVSIQLDTPLKSHQKFLPTVVLFQPEFETIGPVLPIEQPPNTLALVYPPARTERQFQALTQTESVLRFKETLTIPMAGTAYLAVYSAGFPGTFRLTMKSRDVSLYQAAMQYPERWWYSQNWAGWSLNSLFLPGAVVGVIAGGWRLGWSSNQPKIIKTKRRKKV